MSANFIWKESQGDGRASDVFCSLTVIFLSLAFFLSSDFQ
jgi:hypothetical protein